MWSGGIGVRWPLMTAAGITGGLAGREVFRRLRAIDLRGQVVLVTGSSRGLGLVMAQEFARQGARLVLCARNEAELERAREEIARMGAEVLAVPCDVADQGQVQRLVGVATERFGRVDVLVNNAGIITMGPIQNQTPDDFRRSMDVMFWGVLYPTLAVLPQMLERRSGRIVNVTSIGGKVSAPHLLPYESAKFAAVGLSEGLRAELAKEGVTVVTVVPGFMRTGSYVNAEFKGRHRAEYTWFSLLGNLPLTSMSARKAARQIVRAARRGDPEVTLTWQAQLLTRFHALFPGLTAEIFGLVNRLLPAAGGIGTKSARGKESETALTSSPATVLGQRAAREFNQYQPGEDGEAARRTAAEAGRAEGAV